MDVASVSQKCYQCRSAINWLFFSGAGGTSICQESGWGWDVDADPGVSQNCSSNRLERWETTRLYRATTGFPNEKKH